MTSKHKHPDRSLNYVKIYEGTPILKAWQAIPVAGKAIHDVLEAQLLEHGVVKSDQSEEKPLPSVMNKVPEHIVEDIKVRTCFVTKQERAKEIAAARLQDDPSKFPKPPPDVDYPLDGNKILRVDGKLREHACEVLFEMDNEEQSIASLVLDSILKCPIDMRKVFVENIVVIGGTAMLPGFLHRLQLELQDLLDKPKYRDGLVAREFKFHKPSAKSNYTAWLGGAIFGALEILGSRSIARENYSQTGVIPDWSSMNTEDENEDKSPTKR